MPGYSLNTANVSVKHKSINQSINQSINSCYQQIFLNRNFKTFTFKNIIYGWHIMEIYINS